MPRSKKYQDELIESLKDHDEAVAYLNAALEESLKGDAESQEILLMAFRNVAEAQGGIAKVAKKAHLGRESLYKTLSPKGNPELRTVTMLVQAMGLRLQFS
jgi:probable addiction module antidote protein